MLRAPFRLHRLYNEEVRMNICQVSVCLKENHEPVIVNTSYSGKIWRARRGLESKSYSVESYLNKNRSKGSAGLK